MKKPISQELNWAFPYLPPYSLLLPTNNLLQSCWIDYISNVLKNNVNTREPHNKPKLEARTRSCCKLRWNTRTRKTLNPRLFWSDMLNKPFPSSPGPLYHNEVKCSAFELEMIFHSHANKTHFHKKGCALGLILKLRGFRTRKWPIVAKELLLVFLLIPALWNQLHFPDIRKVTFHNPSNNTYYCFQGTPSTPKTPKDPKAHTPV